MYDTRDGEELGEIADGILALGMHAAEFPLLSVGQFGLLAAQFPLGADDGHAFAGAHAERSASNSAKVARILKNSFPIGSPGS